LQNSQNVEVYNNKIDISSGGNGIGLIQQNRGSGTYGPYLVKNDYVHDNTIVSTNASGGTGGAADYQEAAMFSPSSGNRFDNNHYDMPDGSHWWWGVSSSGQNWTAYQRQSGEDQHSTFSTAIPDVSSWVTAEATASAAQLSAATGIADDPAAGEDPAAPVNPADPIVTPGVTLYGDGGSNFLRGSAGDDKIDGGGGNDFIYGLSGNDTVTGGSGDDAFKFAPGFGLDTVVDFTAGAGSGDKLVFEAGIFHNFADFMNHATQVGSNTVISVGAGSDLTLLNVDKTQISSADISFGH
jgi:Ca2+-binding RTX toxin-like protein